MNLVEYMKDPYVLDWLKEYKAKRLAEQHALVSKGMARHAIRLGCKYFIKVKNEHAHAAREQLESIYGDIQCNQCVVFHADGKIFVPDEETFTMLKLLYS